MAYHKFITAVLPEHSRSAMDRLLQAEEKEAEKYTITTTKELQAIKKAAQAQVEAEINMGDMVGMRHTSDARNRKMEDASDTIEIDNMVYFNINYEQFNMIFRNDAIVDFATERINRTAGQVLKGFLDFAKDKMKSLKEDDTPAATPMHIANILAPDLLTQGDIVLQQDILDSHSNRKPSTQETLRGYINLLKLDQSGFLKTRDDLGSNQYSINLYKLRLSMKRKILETLLRERLGVATCRIVRILIEKGKLDESQVQKLAMLPPKDTREKLALLHLHGFVEIQEVPRSADRAPGRSFHLWYVPLEKCYEEILVDIYRVLGNLQQRKKNELAIRSRLLEKLNRKDVIENMDLLSDGDKAEKDNMEKVLARLETSIARLDSMVMILRDF
ncbi:hypothetical protein BJ944DRAFT_156030 [Cunninghamella echinulata]|nr:hypothetical protein BJ944DRAFT_156030 [Cunninghamella echinulata]